ncbi:MAG: hypothetical protein GY906_33635 [bacterium]|nr:hypothetical protein [bacterium]
MTKLEFLTATLNEIGVEYTTFYKNLCPFTSSIYVEIKATSTVASPIFDDGGTPPKQGVFNLVFDGEGEYEKTAFYETGDAEEVEALREHVTTVNEGRERRIAKEAEEANDAA